MFAPQTRQTFRCITLNEQKSRRPRLIDGIAAADQQGGASAKSRFSQFPELLSRRCCKCFRADIEYSTNSSKTYLKIPDVKLKDEGLYKCEATYMAVNRECNNVQHIILNVTGKLHCIMQRWRELTRSRDVNSYPKIYACAKCMGEASKKHRR